MKKTTVFLLFLTFVVLAGITTYAGKAATDRQLQSNATCSESPNPTDRAPKCDQDICPPTAPWNGCPRTDCDTRHGLCCYQCPGSNLKECL